VGLNFHKDATLEKIELSTFFREVDANSMTEEEEKIFKFVTCGDLAGFDAIEEQPEEQI
jgi:hypothetical protein